MAKDDLSLKFTALYDEWGAAIANKRHGWLEVSSRPIFSAPRSLGPRSPWTSSR